MAEGSRAERGVVLAHLVGQSRAYALQLEYAADQLSALYVVELAPLLAAIAQAESIVQTVNALATARLRVETER